ncbi:N/A [soil metagenome]
MALAIAPTLPATEPISARGQAVYPSDAPGILASSYILLDARSGEVLAQKNADQRRPVASTQKLVTALLILERGDLDREITIRREDTLAPPSKMYLKVGQRITRRELLRVFLVKSANDAADALARDHSGSVPAFAQAMNAKARQLGAHSSNFRNPHGLTASGQYSTARDIARIAFVAYRQPFIRDTARLKSVTVAGSTYKSTNKLLGRMPECTGLKTGYTDASGRCLVSTAQFAGRDTLLVQLGSKTSHIFDDAETLMRWGNRPSSGILAAR